MLLNLNKTFHFRHIKLIAHRQFTDEDFNQTLDALNLCPSSTIYVHLDMVNIKTYNCFIIMGLHKQLLNI